jgi:hypothetical protein
MGVVSVSPCNCSTTRAAATLFCTSMGTIVISKMRRHPCQRES